MIKHEGDKWVLYSHDGKKKLGTHDTKGEAQKQEAAINIRKYAQVRVLASAYEVREDTFEGRPHLVVPVVALVQGVLHAMNSATPELVTAEEFTRPAVVGGFDGRPLFHGHPLVNGEAVSGNSPTILEERCIGRVFNSTVKSDRLTVEAWIDVAKCEAVAPELLERVRALKAIEISVGVFCESDVEEAGEYEGNKYAGSWRDIVPDHLALLVEGDRGACSNAMGCGVRAAKQEGQMVKKAGLVARLLNAFRAQQAPEEMSDNDIRRNLIDALREADKTVSWVEAFYPETKLVVYSCYIPSTETGPEMGMGYQSTMYQREYAVDDSGVVTLGETVTEVEPVLTYQAVPTVEGVVAAQAPKAAQGAPCRCQDHKDTRSASDMKKEELVTFLATATDEQLAALSAAVEPAAPAEVAAVVETKVEVPAVAAAAKTPSFEEILATAEPSVRDAIAEGQRVGAAKRAESIKTLKATNRCDLTDKELAALSQAQLDQFVKLAGAPTVDFSAAGASRTQETAQEIPAAPDMVAAIKAARGTK